MTKTPVALAALTLVACTAFAQDKAIALRFASAAPPTSPWAKQIMRDAANVGAESGGAIKIEAFFNSQLGSENDTIAQIARGRVDMGSFTANAAALQIPQIALLNLPLFFDNQTQRDCVLDKHLSETTAQAFAAKGLHFVRWGEVGPIHLPGKQAYATPESIKGIKVGVVTNKMTTEFWQAMGANPVPTAVAEVSSSMQTGLIDTYPTPYAFYVPSGLSKIATVMTKFPLWESAGVVLANKRTYDKMPVATRATFDRGFAKTSNAQVRGEIRGVDAALTKAHQAAGGEVIQATDEQRADWRANLPPVWQRIADDMGAEGKAYYKLMVEGKQACGTGQ
jgi:TRAP-type C4-dicarboxylate transport system substrate-binding protein